MKFKIHWLLAYVLAINSIVFVLYALDKGLCKINLIRVPESLLQLLSFLGGTFGAYVAQQLLRHKIVKERFVKQFKIIVGFQIIVFGVVAGLIIYWA